MRFISPALHKLVGRTAQIAGVVFVLAGSVPVRAATFTVDRTDDDAAATTCAAAAPNDCSLRGAVLAANARPMSEASTINVPAGTYVLSQSSTCTYKYQGNPNFFSGSWVPLCVAKNNVTIQGAGAATTIIDGNSAHRVFFISADATVQLSSVTIAHGLGDRSFDLNSYGGGIVNEGMLTLTDSVVRNNSVPAGAVNGGGIYNTGVLTLLRSAVSDNVSPSSQLGGGISNEALATLTVANSTISNNIINGGGGGIADNGGTVTITGSTISGNRTNSTGGGISNGGFPSAPSSLTITNSTISGNTSGSRGGGIASAGFSDVHLHNVTITNNTGEIGGGFSGRVDSIVHLQNTVIAGNRDLFFGTSPDCAARLISQGYNLIQDTTGCVITGDLTGNIVGQDAQLGLLGDYGGPTKTHALLAGSPAIDAGNPAAPGVGSFACTAIDQRGFNRLQDGNGDSTASCDIGAFELLESSAGFSLLSIRPNTGGNSGSVVALLYGSGFVPGATVKLTRAGQPDIVGSPMQGDVGGSAIAATFDLVGRAIGPWDVVVRNPDGTSKTLAAGFAIEAGRAPELWVDVLGPRLLRSGRSSRLTILYGNRGNVDALAVPLSISISSSYELSKAFAITSPPPQAGQINVNWSQVPVIVQADAQNSSTNVPLLLSVVPAGFTGTLQIVLLFPPQDTASAGFFAIDSPFFNPTLDPQIVSGFVQGAQAYAQQGFDVTIPPALVPDLEQYVTNQLQLVVNNGRNALVANLGTSPQVYSLSQLQIDTALFGARLALTDGQASAKPQEAPNWLSTAYHLFVSLVSQLGPAEAQAQQQNCPPYKPGAVLVGGCSGSGGPDKIGPPPIPPPPGCDPDKIKEQLKTLKGSSELLLSPPECKITAAHCESLVGYHVVTYSNGIQACVPNKCTNTSLIGGDCVPYPMNPRGSHDPNDKAGSRGATPAQFLLSVTPLSYTINFENLETATAAAQEVVITDQLDIQALDLDTFSLGPLSFGGDSTLVPAPGVQQYTGGVDLRPDQNLIVTMTASLDKSTGLLTWRFTSIDPDTGQFTEDPEAGFLPPNVNPPEGQGSVVFTVEPKSGLASGTTICNQASIVFDVNPPILTPQWCNTLDDTPPVSQVFPLAATQSTPTFPLSWSGTDQGSGILDYTIFVSTNGGPFTAFLTDTPDTSATFIGVAGNTYAFYSVARDLAGNTEATPAGPDTQTTVGGVAVHDLAVLKIIAPQIITLTGNVEERTKVVKVQIQNRSPHSETINAFTGLVSLELTSLGSCPAPTAVLISGPPQKKLPVTLKPKGKLEVLFRVTFDCANDLAKSTPKEPGHEDYSLTARVNHVVLDGNPDTHPADDVCPRSVTPPFEVDPNPDGTIKDKGCGEKKDDKTFGAPVLVDVVVKP